MEEEGVKNLRRVRYPTLNRERYAQIRINRVRYPLIGGDWGSYKWTKILEEDTNLHRLDQYWNSAPYNVDYIYDNGIALKIFVGRVTIVPVPEV